MRFTHAFGRPTLGRSRLALATLVATLFAAMALSISATTAPAGAAFHEEAYHPDTDGFMCPVKTIVDGGFVQYWNANGTRYKKSLELTTSITTGYNGYWFAACRASVYVDVLADNGDVLATLDYYPWAGPVSINHEKWDDVEVYLSDAQVPMVEKIRIRQYPRYE
jgi:hypothetical protein